MSEKVNNETITAIRELVTATLIMGARRGNDSLKHDTALELVKQSIPSLTGRFTSLLAAATRWRSIAEDGLPTEDGKKYLVALWNFNVNKPDYGLRMFRDGYFKGAEYTHIRIVAWQEVEPFTPPEDK